MSIHLCVTHQRKQHEGSQKDPGRWGKCHFITFTPLSISFQIDFHGNIWCGLTLEENANPSMCWPLADNETLHCKIFFFTFFFLSRDSLLFSLSVSETFRASPASCICYIYQLAPLNESICYCSNLWKIPEHPSFEGGVI